MEPWRFKNNMPLYWRLADAQMTWSRLQLPKWVFIPSREFTMFKRPLLSMACLRTRITTKLGTTRHHHSASRTCITRTRTKTKTNSTAPTNWSSQLFYEVEIPCHKWRWVGDQLLYNTITKQLKVSIQWIRLDLKRVQGTLNVKYCHGRLRFIQFSMLTATNLYMQGPILD